MTDALHERRAGEGQRCLFLGPRRAPDGRHELVTVFQPLTLADSVALEPAPLGAEADEVSCPGVAGPRRTSRRRAARLPRAHRLGRAAGAAAHRQAHPGRRRAWPAARPTPPPRCGSPARVAGVDDDALLRDIAAGSAPTSRPRSRPARCLATGAGEGLRPLRGPSVATACSSCPRHERLATADVFRGADRLGPRPGRATTSPRASRRSRATPPTCPATSSSTTSSPPRARCARRSPTRSTPSAPPAPTTRCCAGRGRRSPACSPTVDAARAAAVRLGDRTPRPVVATRSRSTRPGAAREARLARRGRGARGYLVWRRRKLEPTLLVGGAIVAVVAAVYGIGLVNLPNLEKSLIGVGETLGPWTYLARRRAGVPRDRRVHRPGRAGRDRDAPRRPRRRPGADRASSR